MSLSFKTSQEESKYAATLTLERKLLLMKNKFHGFSELQRVKLEQMKTLKYVKMFLQKILT